MPRRADRFRIFGAAGSRSGRRDARSDVTAHGTHLAVALLCACVAALPGARTALAAKRPNEGPFFAVAVNVPRGARTEVIRERQDPPDVIVIRIEPEASGSITIRLFNLDERDVRFGLEPNENDSAACGITFDDLRQERDRRVRLRWGSGRPKYPDPPTYQGEETFPQVRRWSAGRPGHDPPQGMTVCSPQAYELAGLPFDAAGAVPDGDRTLGAPLLIERGRDTGLVLTWDPSCRKEDSDYEVYEGSLGDFGSHVPLLCSTDGNTSATVSPGAGNRYFLVVPRNGRREGSYGTRSDGSEIKASASPCLVQKTEPCRRN